VSRAIALLGSLTFSSGCGRVGYEPEGGACPLLPGGGWTFAADPIVALNTSLREGGPFLDADGLTLIFARRASADNVTFDLYVSTRPDRAAEFEGDRLADLSIEGRGEQAYGLSADGLSQFLSAVEASSQRDDLYLSVRGSTAEPFGPFTALTALNTAGDEWDPFAAADGSLIYSSTIADGWGELMRSVRDPSGAFLPGTPIEGLNTAAGEGNPSLTSDGLVIVFNSGPEIFYATRPDADAPFGPAEPLPGVNTADYEGETFLSGDGCELVFVRVLGGASGDWVLHHARYVRVP
jgi:hypothetical protein